MVAITATNTSTPLKPVAPSRSRLEQARRQADLAEANARQLRAVADQAEQEAQQSESKVSTLSAQVAQESRAALAGQSTQSDSTYTAQVKANASPQTKQVQDFLVRISAVALNQFSFPSNPLKSGANSAPVLNAQGQSTGRIVNLSV
jgi:vacuolar-type H+-ATPase subunit D/Vma8